MSFLRACSKVHFLHSGINCKSSDITCLVHTDFGDMWANWGSWVSVNLPDLYFKSHVTVPSFQNVGQNCLKLNMGGRSGTEPSAAACDRQSCCACKCTKSSTGLHRPEHSGMLYTAKLEGVHQGSHKRLSSKWLTFNASIQAPSVTSAIHTSSEAIHAHNQTKHQQ